MSSYIIRNIYYSHFQLCLRYGITLLGGDNESNTLLTLQMKVLQVISDVSNCTQCRQIFKNTTLTLYSLYMLEVTCFIKKYKDFTAENLDIHNNI
jgi:hypothetical protein